MTKRIIATICAIGVCAVALPVSGQRQQLGMLDELHAGSWEIRERGGAVRNVCIKSGRNLIQLRHPGVSCRTLVVEDKPDQVTVQYTCAGQGYGRTQIRRETDGLIQIDSQGIVSGLPFAFSAEGRRTGGCKL